MFDFLKLKQSVAAVGAEVAKLRQERETLLRKREDLESAPICKSDLVALLDGWVDRRGSDFPKRLETGINYYRRHALTNLPENPKAAVQPMAVLCATADPNAAGTIGTLEASLFYVLGDEIKRGLRAAIESLDFSNAGPPRAERVELIAAIDKRIDEIDKAELELVEAAEKAGLRL